ncbi:thiamine phosphate synthase [Paeniglutamicibacter terrestris]|uniref:Thiamine-phosphate synthase n=1 Tax=Paeniglutamicibacter terrestris TaxID=2723403 RepID=A0ABX1G1R2_9MICC|nr:thiamine phosphate synthase [Paeniglutamicibacter terrestris]NKG20181.1 thiamine phosphate synthase [Paeniglutamicibacter terrestris]
MSQITAQDEATPDLSAATISAARLYVCTDARSERGDFAEFITAAYAGGVDIIQLRDKSIDAAHELELLGVLREVAEKFGKPFSVNDRADLAMLSDAPVFHVGQTDLPLPSVRSLLGPEVVLGLSSHDPAQITAAAADPNTDYFCVGPLWATPTKPGRAAVGLEMVEHAASLKTTKPWFAIGGIDLSNVDQVVAAGASRIVVVRAITDADDPAAAAQALLSRLP